MGASEFMLREANVEVRAPWCIQRPVPSTVFPSARLNGNQGLGMGKGQGASSENIVMVGQLSLLSESASRVPTNEGPIHLLAFPKFSSK